MFVVYAHRGASEYYPENTLSSFYAGVDMSINAGMTVNFPDKLIEYIKEKGLTLGEF